MHKFSNLDKLDMTFGGISLSLEQSCKSNSLRWVNCAISLGSFSIFEPIKLRNSSFFSSTIIEMSPNLHQFKLNVQRFVRQRSDEGSDVKCILERSKTLSFFIPSKNVSGIFR